MAALEWETKELPPPLSFTRALIPTEFLVGGGAASDEVLILCWGEYWDPTLSDMQSYIIRESLQTLFST